MSTLMVVCIPMSLLLLLLLLICDNVKPRALAGQLSVIRRKRIMALRQECLQFLNDVNDIELDYISKLDATRMRTRIQLQYVLGDI